MSKEFQARKKYVDFFNMHRNEFTSPSGSPFIQDVCIGGEEFEFVLEIPTYGSIRAEIFSETHRYCYNLVDYKRGEELRLENLEVYYAQSIDDD